MAPLNKKYAELAIGIIVISAGLVVELWSRRLYWILTYPPPLAKQTLDALPPLLWVVGGMLIADGLWRILTSRRPINLSFTRSLMFGAILTLCSLIYSKEVQWPDFHHVNYGFPLAWLRITLSTIAGPAFHFEINSLTLIIDLIFWFTATLAASRLWNKSRPTPHLAGLRKKIIHARCLLRNNVF